MLKFSEGGGKITNQDEVSAELRQEKLLAIQLPDNVTLKFEGDVSDAQIELVKKMLPVIEEISDQMEADFEQELDQLVQPEFKIFSDAVLAWLGRGNRKKPNFTIVLGEGRQEELDSLEMRYKEHVVLPESMLVVFKLPKVVSYFWKSQGFSYRKVQAHNAKIRQQMTNLKENSDLSEQDLDKELRILRGGLINPNQMEGTGAPSWGDIYQATHAGFWKIFNQLLTDQGLTQRRLNQVSEHDPKKFYYVWEVFSQDRANAYKQTLNKIEGVSAQVEQDLWKKALEYDEEMAKAAAERSAKFLEKTRQQGAELLRFNDEDEDEIEDD